MNKSKEAIRDLRNSFELRHCKWAKNCLDTIEEELEKKDNKDVQKAKAITTSKREATRQELIDRINELQSKLKKKDKIIDKATRFLRDLQLSKDLEGYELMNANDWKQYFEKEIENE